MKVGLAGTGWRAQMYVRVMKALGEEFEVSAVYVGIQSPAGSGKRKISRGRCIQTMTNFWQQSRTV